MATGSIIFFVAATLFSLFYCHVCQLNAAISNQQLLAKILRPDSSLVLLITAQIAYRLKSVINPNNFQ